MLLLPCTIPQTFSTLLPITSMRATNAHKTANARYRKLHEHDVETTCPQALRESSHKYESTFGPSNSSASLQAQGSALVSNCRIFSPAPARNGCSAAGRICIPSRNQTEPPHLQSLAKVTICSLRLFPLFLLRCNAMLLGFIFVLPARRPCLLKQTIICGELHRYHYTYEHSILWR